VKKSQKKFSSTTHYEGPGRAQKNHKGLPVRAARQPCQGRKVKDLAPVSHRRMLAIHSLNQTSFYLCTKAGHKLHENHNTSFLSRNNGEFRSTILFTDPKVSLLASFVQTNSMPSTTFKTKCNCWTTRACAVCMMYAHLRRWKSQAPQSSKSLPAHS